MKYSVKKDGTALTLTVQGRLDIKTCPVLEAAVNKELDDVTDFTLDFQDVGFVSSMGLRLLLAWQKRMFKQGAMHVINVRPEVMSLFEETGFTDIIDIT